VAGGFFNLELEGNWASSVNQNTGALMPVNTSQMFPLPPGDIFGVPAWNFAQFLSPYFGLTLGKFATIINNLRRHERICPRQGRHPVHEYGL